MLTRLSLSFFFLLLSPALYAHEHHATLFHSFKLETAAGENRQHESVSDWKLDGWLGGDDNKLFLKSEGAVTSGVTETSENWALYSRNIDTFWDAQLGVRYDNQPESTSYLVAGFAGLAPYHLETEAHIFSSQDGDVSFRLHEEIDLLLTQKLVLQPYFELNAFAQEVKELEVGSGLSEAHIGLKLRYEISRKFSPYIEVTYEKLFGGTADFAEMAGEDASNNSITAGIQLMF